MQVSICNHVQIFDKGTEEEPAFQKSAFLILCSLLTILFSKIVIDTKRCARFWASRDTEPQNYKISFTHAISNVSQQDISEESLKIYRRYQNLDSELNIMIFLVFEIFTHFFQQGKKWAFYWLPYAAILFPQILKTGKLKVLYWSTKSQ